jgi:hypothetical protein
MNRTQDHSRSILAVTAAASTNLAMPAALAASAWFGDYQFRSLAHANLLKRSTPGRSVVTYRESDAAPAVATLAQYAARHSSKETRRASTALASGRPGVLSALGSACLFSLRNPRHACALTFRDYGVTWDEDVHFYYGFKVLDFSLSLGRDKSYLDFMKLHTYGAAFDLLTAALSRVSPISSWEARHLVDGFHPWQPTAGGRMGTRRHARRRFFSTDS